MFHGPGRIGWDAILNRHVNLCFFLIDQKRFTFTCRKFDLEVDLSRLPLISTRYIFVQSLSYLETCGPSPC